MKKILSFILLGLMCSIGNAWAEDYYAPESDEVIILDNIKTNVAANGYSSHAAIAWADSPASSNSKKAGDPNNNGQATSSNVNCYSVKANNGTKTIIVSITNVSKIIVYHEKHASRYLELRSGSKTGTLIGNGSADTYFSEIDLDGTTSYNIYLHGTDGSSDQDLYVYAIKLIKYAAVDYTVSYDANGGSGSMDATTNEIVGCSFIAPAGKVFLKWNTAADGSGNDYQVGGKVSSNLTLYAQWVDLYTVSYNANGGFGSMEDTYSVIVNSSFSAPTGCIFAGWNTAADGSGVDYAVGDDVTSDLFLYAQWELYSIPRIYDFAAITDVDWEALRTNSSVWSDNTENSYLGNAAQWNANTDHAIEGSDGTDISVAEGLLFGRTSNLGAGSFRYYYDNPRIYINNSNGYVKIPQVAAGQKVILTMEAGGGRTISATNATPASISYANGDGKKALIFTASTNGLVSLSNGSGGISIYSIQIAETHSVTYKANGGTGEDIVVPEAFAIAENPFSYTGHSFVGWNTAADGSGVAYAAGDNIPSDLVLFAQWQASFTVTYYYGEIVLGSEEVLAGENPVEVASIVSGIQLATFNGWFSNAELTIPVNPAEAIINSNTNFFASITPIFASSINIEQLVLDNGKGYNLMAQMGALHYASNISNDLDSLDDSKSKRNEPYLGQKIKAEGKLLNFRLATGSTVKVKFGNIGATPQVSINGGAYANMDITNSIYSYDANEETLISIKTVSNSTVVLKQIMIDEDIKYVSLPSSNARVTLGLNGYSTYAADFKYTVSGAEVYKAAYNGSDAVTLTEVVDAVVPANAGIILYGEEGAVVTIAASDADASDFSGNGLVGVVTSTAAIEGTYVLSTNAGITEFNPCQAGVMIPAHKAYISIPSNAPAIRIIFAENGATGINELEGAEKAVKFIENGKLYIQKDGVIYDATGAKVK